jgi:ADP-dependent phosphofructokinase/glucokinase
LDAHLAAAHGAAGLAESGIVSTPLFDAVAVPTILIDQPITLVGMGDTISSLSLVGLH